MRRFALLAIKTYQRFISPYKGFSCAYRVHTGHSSCSTLGYRAVRRYGLFGGLRLIQQRTQLCGVVHRQCATRPAFHNQRGVCDIGCDLPADANCNPLSANHSGKFWELLSSCNCGYCDWPFKKDPQKKPSPHQQRRASQISKR